MKTIILSSMLIAGVIAKSPDQRSIVFVSEKISINQVINKLSTLCTHIDVDFTRIRQDVYTFITPDFTLIITHKGKKMECKYVFNGDFNPIVFHGKLTGFLNEEEE